ncbi:hypothetical protein [Crenobacter intestini]|uniref:Uncharacterized protein n=1 Tax=Crenobacter intestini TaxID=2563443 RepID=A0A4T0V3F7_9NEIS|nr:hypothetical protein [Crenobacter intestini]TIC86164.1 hypothetical protein E5K04_03405 [Crenobacter intestini]
MDYSLQSLIEALPDLVRCEQLAVSMLQQSVQDGQIGDALANLLTKSQQTLADLRDSLPLL